MMESNKALNQVIPDFTITTHDDELQLSLNGRNAPELKVSKTYQEMFKAYAESKKKDPRIRRPCSL